LYRVTNVLPIECPAKRDARRRVWSDADLPLCGGLRTAHQRGQRAHTGIPDVVRGAGGCDGRDEEGGLVQTWFRFDEDRCCTGATATHARTGIVETIRHALTPSGSK
jgi:hypothetical protein